MSVCEDNVHTFKWGMFILFFNVSYKRNYHIILRRHSKTSTHIYMSCVNTFEDLHWIRKQVNMRMNYPWFFSTHILHLKHYLNFYPLTNCSNFISASYWDRLNHMVRIEQTGSSSFYWNRGGDSIFCAGLTSVILTFTAQTESLPTKRTNEKSLILFENKGIRTTRWRTPWHLIHLEY